MKNYIKYDDWSIVEEGWNPENNRISESIFSLGNGRMGHRGNFEEYYSGDTFLGNYIAGVYYPDKTRVGWWKNGYPEYFAKIINAANWLGIYVEIDGEMLDLAKCTVKDFKRVLNMHEGYLERSFRAVLPNEKELMIHSKRFCSITDSETGAICYTITPLNFDCKLSFTVFVDADVINEDSNYDEKFWEEVSKISHHAEAYVVAKTRKTDFHVCTGMKYSLFQNNSEVNVSVKIIEKEKYAGQHFTIEAKSNQETTLHKFGVNTSSENHGKPGVLQAAREILHKVSVKGFDLMLKEQAEAWAKKWELSDVTIEGDVAAQQAIRFNIFQLNQTYTGEDERLNIGPKGFTGEKYGGVTYWDTEAYCIPFYLCTSEQKVARNLLIYRYKHLQKAIENAQKLGFKDGAALYPMVTINGEECHNEWEITFEEIHRNGAMAYAIYNYIKHTSDKNYLIEYGLEVLVAIARFWSQRVNFSEEKQKYVMLGVTGPNEYENNVNNNWYTNLIACWSMQYAITAIDFVKEKNLARYSELSTKINLKENKEKEQWKHIIDYMHLPYHEELGIFLQQDGFMDKEQILVKDLNPAERPLNQKWSWDRILRSCFIKQADVLQGIYFFEEDYESETIRRNFDFYEARTVHESSLSPCIHAILAAKIGDIERAYQFYLRTARLDLDDYNNDTEDGLHITSMAGTWMSVVEGFGGKRVKEDKLYFYPQIPEKWISYSFNILFRGTLLKLKITKENTEISNLSDKAIDLLVYNQNYLVPAHEKLEVSLAKVV